MLQNFKQPYLSSGLVDQTHVWFLVGFILSTLTQ